MPAGDTLEATCKLASHMFLTLRSDFMSNGDEVLAPYPIKAPEDSSSTRTAKVGASIRDLRGAQILGVFSWSSIRTQFESPLSGFG